MSDYGHTWRTFSRQVTSILSTLCFLVACAVSTLSCSSPSCEH